MEQITVKFNRVFQDHDIRTLDAYFTGTIHGYVTHTFEDKKGNFIPCGCAVVLTTLISKRKTLAVVPLWAIELS